MISPQERRQFSDRAYLEAHPFEAARSLCRLLASSRDGNAEARQADAAEALLRMLEHRDLLTSVAPVLSAVSREVGLFPYLDPSELPLRDLLAYEAHRPEGLNDIVFHRKQAQAYRALMSGRNVILSAPTSFGKSLIIDAMVASKRFRNIAVIVPTIALIDETRRRLWSFRNDYKIITHGLQTPGERNILVATQERALESPLLESVEFFVIDEFYKLAPRGEDQDRSLLLNHALYRLLKHAKQFYLLGPNIDEVPVGFSERFECDFIKTDYATVATDVVRVKRPKGKEEELATLVKLCASLDGPVLVYCNSPNSVRKVTRALSEAASETAAGLQAAAAWLSSEYHPDWQVTRSLRSGIGTHHGGVPRAIAQFMVRAFNDGRIRILVCTSTLIEGVNTKAKHVVIFDNKIAKKKFDYFTFNNIVGRSGRMFKHFVGHVYLFHEPPQAKLPFVDIPMFTQDDAPDSLLVQIDDDDLTPKARARMRSLAELAESVLPMHVLRENSGIPPEHQINLAEDLIERADELWPMMNWRSNPTYNQLKLVCELIWRHFKPRGGYGAVSAHQLAFRVGLLRKHGTVKALIDAELAQGKDKSPDDAVEVVLGFCRNWASFRFPAMLHAVDTIQRVVFKGAGKAPGDYAWFAQRVEHLFQNPILMALDEYGLPVQLGKKLSASLQTDAGDLDVALAQLALIPIGELGLSRFEREMLLNVQTELKGPPSA